MNWSSLYWILIISLPTIVVLEDTFLSKKAPGWEERTEWPDDYPRPTKTTQSLFFIQRNLNSNTIVYDVDLKNGKIKSNHPIDVYWLRYGDDAGRHELTWLQSIIAYGYSSKRIDNRYRIRLKAYNERFVELRLVDGNWKAMTKINNIDCYLQNVYVYADESSIFPDVKYADIYGIHPDTGEQVVERILNE